MFFEGLAVFFCCFELFQVERSKVALFVRQVVAEPLAREWGEEGVTKEFLGMFFCAGVFCVGARSGRLGGRTTTLWNNRQFDCTKGYPGEDVCKLPSDS